MIPYNRLSKTTTKGMIKETDTPLDPYILFSLGWFEGIPLQDDTITDHSERAKNLLIEQFEESEKLKTLVGIYVDQIQEIEFAISDIISSRNIDKAMGDSLDIIGERVGESRAYRTDVDYRIAIKFKIFLNTSNGEPETVIEALKTFAQANTIHYLEPYPATILLLYQSDFLPPAGLKQKIEQISPAGVEIMIAYTNNYNSFFAFDGEGGFSPLANTAGFGEINNNVGGQFMELLT